MEIKKNEQTYQNFHGEGRKIAKNHLESNCEIVEWENSNAMRIAQIVGGSLSNQTEMITVTLLENLVWRNYWGIDLLSALKIEI